jgi:hypothetical protein
MSTIIRSGNGKGEDGTCETGGFRHMIEYSNWGMISGVSRNDCNTENH